MSLWDTDKNSDHRNNPTLNQKDQVLQRMASGTTSIHPVTSDTTTSGYLQTKDGRILANDGSNNIGLFGFDSTGAMVVKVAKTGYDADTAANANLVFNSSQNMFKIVNTYTLTNNVVLDGTGYYTQVATQAHGLGFTPSYQAFISIDSFYEGLASGLTTNGPNPFLVSAIDSTHTYVKNIGLFQVSVDATNIKFSAYIVVGGTGSTLVHSAKVYLLQETAN